MKTVIMRIAAITMIGKTLIDNSKCVKEKNTPDNSNKSNFCNENSNKRYGNHVYSNNNFDNDKNSTV